MDLMRRRIEAGLRQRDLARRVGCLPSRISKLERGIEEMTDYMEARLEAGLAGKPVPVSISKVLRFKSAADEEWFHQLWVDRYV